MKRRQIGEADEGGAVDAAPRNPLVRLQRRMRSLDRIEARLPSHVGLKAAALLFALTGLVGVISAGRVEEVLGKMSEAGGLVVESVKITGQMETSEVAVLAKLDLPPDASLPAIDVDAARERIETLPWVQNASLRKIYPSTLKITIDERTPYVLWQHGQTLQVLDDTGRVIGDPSESHRDLVRVVGEGADKRAGEALALADTAPEIRKRLKAAVLVGERRWNLVLDNGVTILLPQEAPKAALRRIETLEESDRLLSRDIVSIDLRLGDRMYVRLSTEAAAKRQAWLKEQQKLAKRRGAST